MLSNRFVKGLTPPYLIELINIGIRSLKKNELFEGDDYLFKKLTKETTVYGEYGCGQSTLWIARNTNNIILTVETSKKWADKIIRLIPDINKLKIDLINLGQTVSYGYPKTYKKRKEFNLYCNSIWNHKEFVPEIVLIDGRFRVACFLTCLLKAKNGTKLIFDDYLNNPHYHLVEEFLKPKEYCGRQALFIVPIIEKNSLCEKRIVKEIANFQYVLD